MLYLFCALLAAGLIAADQLLKWWVVVNLGGAAFDGAAFSGLWLSQPKPLIPHVLGLNFATNTGAAWSILEEHTWLLSALSCVAIAVILWALVTRRVGGAFGTISLAVVLAGAAGNLIDRVRLGYVVDMFETLFINFPIFNLADVCVVCGGIAFCVYLLFFHDKWKIKS
ncbi:MAG: signal peptidase II [Oscillospiraceae bacterium]|nr:signal peptidase II [Oscillospiraceae bacterium]